VNTAMASFNSIMGKMTEMPHWKKKPSCCGSFTIYIYIFFFGGVTKNCWCYRHDQL